MRENTDQKNSEYTDFSRSVHFIKKYFIQLSLIVVRHDGLCHPWKQDVIQYFFQKFAVIEEVKIDLRKFDQFVLFASVQRRNPNNVKEDPITTQRGRIFKTSNPHMKCLVFFH